ncbi:MAG: hypothetical protein SCK29_07205 [Bacillota bacterium]|nr:hypothetical protein [Bacillota bacterium]MDW7683887.1 hypothetical protein [Bacillota bacterium]
MSKNLSLDELKAIRPVNITAEQAAHIMGATGTLVRFGLQQEKFPFGAAVHMEKQWRYYINTERFMAYMTAQDIIKGNENPEQV